MMRPATSTTTASGYAQGRRNEPTDFPALASPHQSQAQQAFYAHQQQQQQSSTNTVPPPPPPGLDTTQQVNGTGAVGERLKTEDFPALGGEGAGAVGAGMTNGRYASTITTGKGRPNGQESGGIVPPPTHTTNATHAPGGVALLKPVHQLVSSPVDKWGLDALLTLIRTGGKDDQLGLQLGDDLMGIGLDMQAPTPLYPTFTSPWQEPDSARNLLVEEDYKIPACYNVQTPAASTKIGQFSDETLFYAFYTCPQDVLQMEVAAELYMRNWRWHKELSVWLTRDPNEQTEQGPGYERGVFYYFDPNRYEKAETPKDFVCHYDRLEERPEWLNRQERAAQGTQQGTTAVTGQPTTTTTTGTRGVSGVQSLQSQGIPTSTSIQNQNQQQPIAQTS